MKKSDIYKYALLSVITDLAAENRNGEADPERNLTANMEDSNE